MSTYWAILRAKGFLCCWHELLKACWPVWWTRSKAAIEQIQSERASSYLWRRYQQYIVAPFSHQFKIDGKSEQHNHNIWVLWLQGREAAPEIVKSCIASVEQYMSGYDIHVLTADNIAQYCSLPKHVWEKYRLKKIPFTQFSDIVRTALLVQHGGVWLDATVLLTAPIPDYILRQPLFMFRSSVLSKMPHVGSNWFLVARKGNLVLQRQLELLCLYWQKERGLRDYFIFHLFLYLLFTKNKEVEQLIDKMPYVPNADVHTLSSYLTMPFDARKWSMITSRSCIHKLSYKLRISPPQNSFYKYILCNYSEN